MIPSMQAAFHVKFFPLREISSRDAVSFNAGRTRSLKLASQYDLMHQRWMHMAMAFVQESEAGKMINDELTVEFS